MTAHRDRVDVNLAMDARRSMPPKHAGLSRRQWLVKRTFDVVCAAGGLLLVGWAIPLLALVARISTGGRGIFRQTRVGQRGVPFEIRKLRTMRVGAAIDTTVTTADDPRITRFGRFLRRSKLDELPQLMNVLQGEMSFVGPRPDVPEFVALEGEQAALILSVPPGITGPATLVFRDEEELLAGQADAESYNRDVLVPTKARINEHYVRAWRFRRDIHYIFLTLRGARLSMEEATK
jgi:lipopolysaccharide/colanic/teichoic acid biosynthesis glycosyltransferase